MMATHPIDAPDLPEEEATPDTVLGWQRWIAERLEDTENGYRSKPDLLKHDANAEKSIARDYANRELLELVQNAADAAAEQGGKGRVRIEIRPEGFCVANTGMPFRAGGVRSLMTAHLSDKPERGATLIGAKGLGFRALLNWSSEPFVTSGDLEIGFSRTHAAAQVTKLAHANARIQKLIDRSRRMPVPILPFPASGSMLDAFADPARLQLIARARALRAQGYDTVVAAPFEDEKAHQRALKQLAEFAPDFLLFVEAIGEIILDDSEGAPRCWSKQTKGGDRFTLRVARGETATEQDWRAVRAAGTLPDSEEPGGVRRYELAIAVRCGEPTPPGTLHCYFPTDIPLPFPALFHATLELDSSRKTLNANSDVNESVLTALSFFYADTLAAFRDDPDVPRPLTLLARTGLFPEPLKPFETQTYAAARARPLIPTNAGAFATADETKVEPSAYSTYLPNRFFPTLAHSRSEADRNVIERLSVEVLKQDDMLAVLRGAEMTLDERATAIVGIAKAVRADLHDRSLLLDTNVRCISLDPVLMRRDWLAAYAFTTERGARFITDYARAANPFARVGERTISVQVTSVVRASDRSFQVKWIETAYERGSEVGSSHWTGILTIVAKPPASADTLRKNPLGIYVDAIDWSRELEAQAAATSARSPSASANVPLGSPLDPNLTRQPTVQPETQP